MPKTKTELTYLRASVENASSVELVVILYDLLISDLRGAIAALANKDIEQRSNELKHAFLVLDEMDASLDQEGGGLAAQTLSRFYAALRASVMEGHVKASSEILSRQIELLFQVRRAWVQAARTSSPASQPKSTAESAEDIAGIPALAGSWSV